MLVCHCKVVNDRTIRRCVDEGAHTRREVGRACGAGTCCGGCRTLVDEVIEGPIHLEQSLRRTLKRLMRDIPRAVARLKHYCSGVASPASRTGSAGSAAASRSPSRADAPPTESGFHVHFQKRVYKQLLWA